MSDYILMNYATGELQTVIVIEDDNNSIIRIGDYNYTLDDIADHLSHVYDANNQRIYLIDWDNEIMQPAPPEDLDDDDDGWEDESDEEASWDDEPTPVPGHYGPSPEPYNLPNPVTLFQEAPLEVIDYEQI